MEYYLKNHETVSRVRIISSTVPALKRVLKYPPPSFFGQSGKTARKSPAPAPYRAQTPPSLDNPTEALHFSSLKTIL